MRRNAFAIAVFLALIVGMDARADWPRWRGRDSSGCASSSDNVFSTWPTGGVPQLWQTASSCSSRYGSIAATGGKVYLLGGSNAVMCLSAADGSVLWTSPAGVAVAMPAIAFARRRRGAL